MSLSSADITAIILTLQLASVVTVLLLLLGTPLAWWLARTQHRGKVLVNAVVALPLVLPPTVLGFYLLLAMGPSGPIGAASGLFGLGTLAFSFPGLVLGSMVYSLPFVVQPLQNTFASIEQRHLEVAASLGARPLDQFVSIVLPLSRPGFLTAAVLGFAHTVGEFGLVLMIGGNIPGQTRVVSVQLYDHVEALAYSEAHSLALILLLFSFVVLLMLYWLQGGRRHNRISNQTPGMMP